MTVQAQNSVQYYNGPIEIGTELSIVEFTFIDNSHVSAKVRGNTEVWRYGYDYTVSGAQTLIRTITVQRRVAENEVLAVYLDVPITQNISPEEGGNFPASTNEYVLDKLTYISQMLDERLKRSLQISIDTPFSGTLPAPEPNKALKISSDGNSFVMSDYDPDTALVLTEQYRSEAQQSAAAATASQNAAKASENNAAASATTATQKANQVESIYEEAVPELTSIIANGVTTLSNASNALRTTQITNCLIEVPQNIKLELHAGTLTLKAGSKVVVPNGFEADGTTPKFDEVIMDKDINSPNQPANRTWFMCWDVDAKYLGVRTVIDSYSGTTQPTAAGTYQAWYDTANNLMKYTSDSGATWKEGLSLPICICTSSNDASYTSIDQVFNGFGYIGSTIWVDKGVKGLIPNGRNEDGTLKNIEFTTSKVLTRTDGGTANFVIMLSPSGLYNYVNYTMDSVNNYILNSLGNVMKFCVAGTFTRTSGVISNFQPKQPFKAVDYSDVEDKVENKVSKAGDTMTGALKIEMVTPHQVFKSTNMAINDSTAATVAYMSFTDKNSNPFGTIGLVHQPTTGNYFIINPRDESGVAMTQPFIAGRGSAGDFCSFPMATTIPTATSTARTNLISAVVANYRNGNTWYIKFSDNFKIQGGYATQTGDGTVTLSLPLSALFAGISTQVNSISDNEGVRICQPSGTGFLYNSPSPFYWVVYGW